MAGERVPDFYSSPPTSPPKVEKRVPDLYPSSPTTAAGTASRYQSDSVKKPRRFKRSDRSDQKLYRRSDEAPTEANPYASDGALHWHAQETVARFADNLVKLRYLERTGTLPEFDLTKPTLNAQETTAVQEYRRTLQSLRTLDNIREQSEHLQTRHHKPSDDEIRLEAQKQALRQQLQQWDRQHPNLGLRFYTLENDQLRLNTTALKNDLEAQNVRLAERYPSLSLMLHTLGDDGNLAMTTGSTIKEERGNIIETPVERPSPIPGVPSMKVPWSPHFENQYDELRRQREAFLKAGHAFDSPTIAAIEAKIARLRTQFPQRAFASIEKPPTIPLEDIPEFLEHYRELLDRSVAPHDDMANDAALMINRLHEWDPRLPAIRFDPSSRAAYSHSLGVADAYGILYIQQSRGGDDYR